MNVFSIRDIENLTGIKAHTLRIWEQRYNLFNPKRKKSQHRFYDNEDLKYILRIAYLYNQGVKISKIACFSESEIKNLTLELKCGEENYEIYINQLTEASLDFDQVRFDKILHNLVLHAGFEKSITCVLFPLLKKMGNLWLTGHVIPAQEHFASALIVKKMLVAIDGLPCPRYDGGRRVLLFTPTGENHEMPLLFMHYLLKKKGVPYVYCGKCTSLETLEDICRQQPVSQLYFHLITNLTRCDVNAYLCKLSRLFPDKEIVFSGSKTCHASCPPRNVRLLRTNDDLQQFPEK